MQMQMRADAEEIVVLMSMYIGLAIGSVPCSQGTLRGWVRCQRCDIHSPVALEEAQSHGTPAVPRGSMPAV
jgi:hypothetical protein